MSGTRAIEDVAGSCGDRSCRLATPHWRARCHVLASHLRRAALLISAPRLLPAPAVLHSPQIFAFQFRSRRSAVAHYLIQGTYTAEGLKGLIKDKASGRKEAVSKALASAG